MARVQAKAAYEANRPTEPTYKIDPTDSVFDTGMYEPKDKEQTKPEKHFKSKKRNKKPADAKCEKDATAIENRTTVAVADSG